MNALVSLAFTYLPKVIDAVKLLRKVPEAVETVKDLTAYVKSTVEHLKQKVPLTPAQETELDGFIDALKDQPHWQPEEQG